MAPSKYGAASNNKNNGLPVRHEQTHPLSFGSPAEMSEISCTTASADINPNLDVSKKMAALFLVFHLRYVQ